MIVTPCNFMRECDIIIDMEWGQPDLTCDFSNKKIFVRTDYFESVLPKLQQSSNVDLILHHSDRPFDRLMFEAVRPFTRRIFAQNCEIIHPQIVQLPIGVGFDDRVPGRQLQLDPAPLNKARALNIPRDIDIYVNFGMHVNNEVKFNTVRSIRGECLKVWGHLRDTKSHSKDEFFAMLRRSKYVLCPMGFGIDSHRFYEVAYLGARPVVISSGLDSIHKKFGAVILDKWDDPLPEWSPPNIPEEIFHTSYWMNN